MTDKKDKILNAALKLFSKIGFSATSTSKIAKKACVSEGLIFRHFGNKEGLLQEIIKDAEDKVKVRFSDIIFESDPQKVIEKTLDFMSLIANNKEESEFWKLQYKIKWEIESYDDKKMEPLYLALSAAFRKLNYASPEKEAKLLLILMDGLATRYYLQEDFDLGNMLDFIQDKYKD